MIDRKFNGAILRTGGKDVRKPVLVGMAYDVADPYTVKVSFMSPGEESVTWRIGRELLWKGTRSRQALGDGDVRVRLAGVGVILCLRTPEGHADIGLPLAEVDGFLVDTVTECPLGQEDVDAQLDRVLADILGESA